MIAIRYEGSRVHKPWVVAEGEVRKLWPNAPPTWETDQILGTFQLQREAADFLLMYHIKGVLPKVKKKVGMRVAKPPDGGNDGNRMKIIISEKVFT